MLHSSKPQTLAPALTDSLAGLASWIVEKMWRSTDNDGDVKSAISRDDILTNRTVYRATETVGSSMRVSCETVRNPGVFGRAAVPTAFLMSPKDMFPTPRSWVERTARVDRWTEIDRRGHFRGGGAGARR